MVVKRVQKHKRGVVLIEVASRRVSRAVIWSGRSSSAASAK